MSSQKWNTFPHLPAAELDDNDQLPVSDDSKPDGDKDATTTIAALRDALLSDAGDVTGPTGSTPGNLAVFADSTGKLLADGGPPSGGGGGIQPAEGLSVLQHGDDSNTPRPAAAMVVWRGSATPVNALDGDLWDDDSGWDV